MARAGLDVGELLLKLVSRETGEISKVDYTPQKPEFNYDSVIGETYLERRSPESQGVSSAFFTDIIRKLSENKESNTHKLMFLRHGYVIAECAFEPYSMDVWHVSYSMCKSIVGMAIGILVDEGVLRLDEKLSDIFSSRMSPFGFLRKNVTVKHLLIMSSGVDFSEAGAISGNDWRKGFLEASFKFDPGTQFEYNSMNSYMLSAIVTEKTGKSLYEFVNERIFAPMGIYRTFWESCPQSITKAGWGLFIRIEDMAKLGQLYLQKGKWEGKQIVPEEWVNESISWQIETGKEDNGHYGYQLWINDDRPGSYAYNGMLGQNVFIYPDIDMVVVTNAGNSDIFQTSKMATIIREGMKNIEVSDSELAPNDGALNELKAICKHVSGRNADFPVIVNGGWKTRNISMTTGRTRKRTVSFADRRTDFKTSVYSYNVRNENQLIINWLSKLDGKTYDLDVKCYGIMPLMMQIVHNNFTDGMYKIGFRLWDNNSFYIDIYEGMEIYSLRCGFGGKRYVSKINMHGEIYEVSLVSFCKTDEYNRLVIRNEINFIEEACLRTFNICFIDNPADRDDGQGTFIHPSIPSEIEVRLLETPGTDMLIETMKSMAPEAFNGLQGKIFGKLFKGGIKEVFEQAVIGTIQPVIHGTLSLPEYKEIKLEDDSDNNKISDELGETETKDNEK
ncbi:serine hydrolase domain-containing protein [Butyrivibrio sp. YAB3001]|uniref:serine hydrolase domain-containing protein n=1 Tax=Butyrivibrio sp. YAB3001 TaxID=1520812 RepID=UPI0008F68DEA|nr:serine hydrolase [Butyrivibrio sp. YAB3001]SFB68390.1 CubicO group peptidase, beta-lactamase class C family [Butyrivibrio sp. YAB3001]